MIFPLRAVFILDTMANLGLIYFVFIIGVEIDRSNIHRSTKSAAFAAACMAVPFLVCVVAALTVPPRKSRLADDIAFLIFLCITLSITAFSVLARRLAELKLLNTSLGTTALTAAMIVDCCAWVLLAVSITLQLDGIVHVNLIYTLLSALAFYLFMVYVVKRGVQWVINITPEGKEVDELYIFTILVMVMVSAFITDAIGIHAVAGAFTFGLVIPNGRLGETLIERIEDLVEGLLLPLFFMSSGMKMNFAALARGSITGVMFMVTMVVAGTAAKIAGCTLVSRLYDMSLRDGIAMGLLMNTRGVVELVLLNIGRDRKLLNEESFTMLVCLSVLITFLTNPLLSHVARPVRRLALYSRRTVEWPKLDAEFRVVLGVHTARQVPTVLAFLDITNPTKQCPISIFALHLIELTSRASAMMIVTSANTKDVYASNPLGSSFDASAAATSNSIGVASTRSHSEKIMHAFETYEQQTGGVSVQPLTAVSPYTSMHHDICEIAEESQAALVVLPFHKQHTVDGGMEVTNPAIHTLNRNVLRSAPCSTAILIDRGFRTTTTKSSDEGSVIRQNHVMVLFLGGPDDREAIALTSRMVNHPAVSLMVMRFVAIENSPKAVNMMTEEEERERQSDNDCIGDFRLRYAEYKTVTYVEREVGNVEETVATIKATMSKENYNLCVVGRGGETRLSEWCECPELGLVGDLLASADFGWTASVLVVQQCKERPENAAATQSEEALPGYDVVYDSRRYNTEDDVYESRRYNAEDGVYESRRYKTHDVVCDSRRFNTEDAHGSGRYDT